MPTKGSSAWHRAKANGYKAGAFKDKDRLKGVNKHVDKVKNDQDQILKLYVTWWKGKLEEEEGRDDLSSDSVRDLVLGKGVPAPQMEDVKDFLRFYGIQSKGKLMEHASAESVKTQAEFFFAGFTRVTGTQTIEEERTDVYWFTKHVLPQEGHNLDVCYPKYNFSKEDLDRVLLALWARKDLIYISERDRVEFTFLLHTYCWTGARVDAFFKGDGLTYKDVHLFLRRRTNSNGYEFMWEIDQRWVKGNRNPNTVVFGAAGKEHSRLLYNDGAMLLPMAFADNALFGFDCLDDLWQQEIPLGDNVLTLRWNDSGFDSVLDTKIVRMSKSTFLRILRSTLDNADYVNCRASIHQIRRCLGKRVDKRYTEVERSQHILQSDPRIFGQSYVANCSSVDGQAAFLGEEADHSVIEYFQGLGRFREPGAPTSLPAGMRAGLRNDPDVVKLQEAAARGDGEASKAMWSLLRSREHRALVSYKAAWVRERRDWKILTRGKVSPEVETDSNQLALILPERNRLQAKMSNAEPLSTVEMREAIQDIYTLITRNYKVFYLPGEEPVGGLCPVCSNDVESLPVRNRSKHIHGCRRNERAAQLDQKPSSLEYCFDCTEWYVQGPKWDEHCQQHLSRLTYKSCASIIYRRTLIKRAYCPDCLGRADISPSLRMKSWDRDADVLTHMEMSHSTETCLHPLCRGAKFEDKESCHNHRDDAHGLRRASGVPRKRKREDATEEQQHREEGSCINSRYHTVDSPENPEADDAANCLSVDRRCETLDNKDAFDLPNSNESLDDFISECIAYPSPDPSFSSDEALLDHPAATEYKTITDADADKSDCSVIETDSHAERPTIQIKLNYKRPKIILRTGKAQRLGKRCRRNGKG